jgi:hypothetical protein
MDVRVDPGELNPQQERPAICSDCYTCPKCEAIYRDILGQKSSGEPDQDVWPLKDGVRENSVYSNIMAPPPSPGLGTVKFPTPRFVPLAGSLA